MSPLLWIDGKYFVAGAIVEDKRIQTTAPILHYTIGWGTRKFLEYCRKKNWTVQVLMDNQWRKVRLQQVERG